MANLNGEGESNMAEMHDVLVKVISAKGKCINEHKVGDKWVVCGKSPEGLCLSALCSLLPYIKVLSCGGTFPWAPDNPDVIALACPDPANPVVFELRRIGK
jgi:uncharacterized repeat protein (TIGR04076 family)